MVSLVVHIWGSNPKKMKHMPVQHRLELWALMCVTMSCKETEVSVDFEGSHLGDEVGGRGGVGKHAGAGVKSFSWFYWAWRKSQLGGVFTKADGPSSTQKHTSLYLSWRRRRYARGKS